METCGPDTSISVECGSTYERRSPAGSSRPGSAKPINAGVHVTPGHMETTTIPKPAIHNRPSTTGTHSKQAAQATPRCTEIQTDSICRSASKGNKPASQHKSTGTQPSNISTSTSVTRQKERRTEREMHRDKDNRSRTEGDKQTGREKQKCSVMERDKEIWIGRTRKKQVDEEKEKKRDGVHSKNQAAIVIQRAWRRYWCLFFSFHGRILYCLPTFVSSIGFKYVKSPLSNNLRGQNSEVIVINLSYGKNE